MQIDTVLKTRVLNSFANSWFLGKMGTPVTLWQQGAWAHSGEYYLSIGYGIYQTSNLFSNFEPILAEKWATHSL